MPAAVKIHYSDGETVIIVVDEILAVKEAGRLRTTVRVKTSDQACDPKVSAILYVRRSGIQSPTQAVAVPRESE